MVSWHFWSLAWNVCRSSHLSRPVKEHTQTHTPAFFSHHLGYQRASLSLSFTLFVHQSTIPFTHHMLKYFNYSIVNLLYSFLQLISHSITHFTHYYVSSITLQLSIFIQHSLTFCLTSHIVEHLLTYSLHSSLAHLLLNNTVCSTRVVHSLLHPIVTVYTPFSSTFQSIIDSTAFPYSLSGTPSPSFMSLMYFRFSTYIFHRYSPSFQLISIIIFCLWTSTVSSQISDPRA